MLYVNIYNDVVVVLVLMGKWVVVELGNVWLFCVGDVSVMDGAGLFGVTIVVILVLMGCAW